MKKIDGKKLAETIRLKLREQLVKENKRPGLAAILVGDNKASELYIKIKKKACQEVGIEFYSYVLDDDMSKETIIETIAYLNNDNDIDGIIVQLPLPNREWQDEVISHIAPHKDVDGFHPENLEKLLQDDETGITPSLPLAIMHLIAYSEQDIVEKNALIICNSEIFATPLHHMLKQKGIDSSIDIRPEDTQAKELIAAADVIIIAIGQAGYITADMVKDGVVIIDVGINRNDKGKLCGDVDKPSFEENEKDAYVTPVPGGVGPMCVATLLHNLVKQA
jgi:methylenetetrahydrofolate dehydrogenase (NADP+)/methenyltetrahydrofolate cyclohydrolase